MLKNTLASMVALLFLANSALQAQDFLKPAPQGNSLVGKWKMTMTYEGKTIGGPVTFEPNGNCVLQNGQGKYTEFNGILTITYPTGQSLGGPMMWKGQDFFTHSFAGLTCVYERDTMQLKAQAQVQPNSVVGNWRLTITSPAGTKNGPVGFTANGICQLSDSNVPYMQANGYLTIDLGNSKLSGPIVWNGPERFTLTMNNTTFAFDREQFAGK